MTAAPQSFQQTTDGLRQPGVQSMDIWQAYAAAQDEIRRLKSNLAWLPIETAPTGQTPHDKILVGFMGQFAWMPFVAFPMGRETQAPGYAKPTHWMPLPPDPAPALQPATGGQP